MKPERVTLMPHWPGRMDCDLAALYMGVSATTFRNGVRERTYPQPVREGKRMLWARPQLDRFIDAQFGTVQPSANDAGDATWDDLR